MIRKTKPHKPDVAQIVMDQVLDALERGRVSRKKSSKAKRGINLLLPSSGPNIKL